MSICVASDKRRLVKLIALFCFAPLLCPPVARAAAAPQPTVTSATKIESLMNNMKKPKRKAVN